MLIETPRTRLRCWRDSDREPFAAINADPEVMRYLGGPLSREESDERIDTYMNCLRRHGFCRWALERRDGRFLGCAGVMAWPADHEPLGEHVEVGWRLARDVWGQGYVTEAARAALDDVFTRIGLSEVLAYTDTDNVRSQAVMARLGLKRDPSRDFSYTNSRGVWEGWVWVARPKAG